MAVLDEGYESGEDLNPFARQVDALLELPIEGVMLRTKRHLERLSDPSFRQMNKSQLKSLLVHKAAIQAYVKNLDLNKCQNARNSPSGLDSDDANLLSRSQDLVDECDHAIRTSEALLAIDNSQKSIHQAENVLLLTRLSVVFLPLTLMSSFFGMNAPPSGVATTCVLSLVASLLFAVFYERVSLMQYTNRAWPRATERFRSLAVSLRIREPPDLEQGGWGLETSHKSEKQWDPEKSGHTGLPVGKSDIGGRRYGMQSAGCVQHGDNHRNTSNGGPDAPSQELRSLGSACFPGQPASQRLKRRRKDVELDETGRFPCIYFVGDESGRFVAHTKKYSFISQLLRHLRTHEFFACPKCFTRFPTEAEEEDHQLRPCVKACRNRRCKRYCTDTEHDRPARCEICITTPEMQWCQLFKLEYSNKPMPAGLFSSEQITYERSSTENSNDLALGENLIDFDDIGGQPEMEAADVDQAVPVGWETMPFFFEHARSSALNHDQTHVQETAQELPSTFELLPVASTRSDREQDLEAALLLIWDALRRSGSTEGLPGSSAHRVLQRLAPELLN